MMKIVKPKVRCTECGNIKEYEQKELFCDYCNIEINTRYKNSNINMLDITVFSKYDPKQDYITNYQFCSWKCLIEKLKTIECDHFVSLPSLIYEPIKKGLNVTDFLELLK